AGACAKSIGGAPMVCSGDYGQTAGTLSFPAGKSTQTIAVPVNGNRMHQPDRTFSVVLTAPDRPKTALARGNGVIVDNDPVPSLTIDDADVDERDFGSLPVLVTVRLSNPTSEPVTADWATPLSHDPDCRPIS